jgi:hypothetical protein
MPLRRLRPLHWLTALLAPGLFLLGLWPAARSEFHLDFHLTQIAVWLANSVAAIESLKFVESAPVPRDTALLPAPFPVSIPSVQLVSQKAGSRITVYVPPPAARAPVAPTDQAEDTEHFKITDSDKEKPQATSQSDVRRTPPEPVDTFHPKRTDVLVPVSQEIAEEANSAEISEPESFSIDISGSAGTPHAAKAAAGSDAKPADGYEVALVSSVRLAEIRVTVSRLDAQGKEIATLRKDEELGYVYYPSAAPTIFSTGKLGPMGFYRLTITAIPKSTAAPVSQSLDLYHPGD